MQTEIDKERQALVEQHLRKHAEIKVWKETHREWFERQSDEVKALGFNGSLSLFLDLEDKNLL